MAVTRRNGRWQARYRDETGRQHAKMFDRKVDAQRWEIEALGKLSEGTWIDPQAGRTTFREYADDWAGDAATPADDAAQVRAVPTPEHLSAHR